MMDVVETMMTGVCAAATTSAAAAAAAPVF
jgi:hypothetical protein